MASSDAKANHEAISNVGASVFANLPNELKDSVIDELPNDLANQVQPHRVEQKRKRMAASRAAITLEKLKATSKTPITKLPTEIRAKIFKHLLPDKRTPFVPLKMLKHCREKRQNRQLRAAMMANTSHIVLVDSDDASTFGASNDADIGVRHEMDFDNMILPLMLTSRQFCTEVSTIMYEEYTFELHVHHDGLDFLDLKRINILEDYGAIENTLCKYGKFESTGSFSFRRMKHLKFVLWGGNPSDRTAGMRMRHTINKLIDLLEDEKKPITTLMIEFEQEADAKDDNIGSFWKNNSSHDARSSIWHRVSNIELITSPFMRLRNVSNIRFDLPMGIDDTDLFAYKQHFCSILRETEQVATDGLVSYEHEQMMMDAVMDYHLEHATVPTEGYYHPDKATHSVGHDVSDISASESVTNTNQSPLKATTIPFLNETEVDEGGSILEWTPKSDPVLSIVYQSIENGVRTINDWEEELSMSRHLIPDSTPNSQETSRVRNQPQQAMSLRTMSPSEAHTSSRNAASATTPSSLYDTSLDDISLDDLPFPIETLKPAKFSDLAGDDGHYKPLKNAMSHMFSVGRDSTPLYRKVPPRSYGEQNPMPNYYPEKIVGASILDNNKGGDDDNDDDTRSLLSVY
jgi:hypothetical protein